MSTAPVGNRSLNSSGARADRTDHIRTACVPDLIHLAERCVYVAIGAMLILTLAIALASACKALWDSLPQWYSIDTIVHGIDHLLFILMLVEILHTVHASIRTGTLVCEPFLIVALIACIRRILVITLAVSQITEMNHWTVNNASLFRASMEELGVLALLIMVLVGSIRVTRAGAK
jgi:uncharacterized membrane protein (DUF373 family)